jgi:hypothetical protein
MKIACFISLKVLSLGYKLLGNIKEGRFNIII